MSVSDAAIVESNPKTRLCKPGWTSWSRYSEGMLREVEKTILGFVKTAYRGFFVDIGPVVSSADKVWTISMNTDSTKTPLVLLHGFGAGVALWCTNLDSLAASRPVYAIDILGFGRSSRPTFSTDALEAEKEFVRSIEEWRNEMKLDKFVLLGHSMGGFLATSYAMSYPDRVKHLILADPWGFPEKPPEYKKSDAPWWLRAIAYSLTSFNFNPLVGVRAAGPFGPKLIHAVRPDITKKFTEVLQDATLIPEYIYQCNAQTPSGETAFRTMTHGLGWAKHPMVNRIHEVSDKIPMTLIYGSRSWVDQSASETIKEKRMHSYVKVQIIPGAGHHVYADRPAIFNQFVNQACELADTDSNKHLAIKAPSSNSKPKPDVVETKGDKKVDNEKEAVPIITNE